MESFIPSREGCVALKTFTDGSWVVEIEYQSIVIANPSSSDFRIWLKEYLIDESNPEWLPEVKEWFSKIEKIWQTFA